MPKLAWNQWVFVIVFQVLFGLLVFAMTREYYLRHGQVSAARVAVPAVTGSGTTGSMAARTMAGLGLPTGEPDLSSDDPAVLVAVGDQLFGQGRYDQAIKAYEKVLLIDPADVEVYNDLGLARQYTGDGAGAIQILKAGVGRDPGFQRIWLTLGFVQLKNGDPAGAAVSLRQALELGAETPVGIEARRLLDGMQGQPETSLNGR